MKKVKTLDDSLYNRLLETLWTVPEDEASDPEILDFMMEVLQDDLNSSEPICNLEDDEYKITRLGILNTVINTLLPGYRLVLEVDEDEQTIGDVYLAEV